MKNRRMRTTHQVVLTALMMHAGFVGAMEKKVINLKTMSGNTPLYLATVNRDFGMVNFLLEQNADANIGSAADVVPLVYAVKNMKDSNLDIINLLLPCTKDKSCLNQKDTQTGETILHRFARRPNQSGNLKVLLEHGAKQFVSYSGTYPIHEATMAGWTHNVLALKDSVPVDDNDDATSINDEIDAGAKMKALFDLQQVENHFNNPQQ